jgi:CRISPR-associated protein Csm4
MGYSLYRLEFKTGLHMGLDTGGPSLAESRMTVHSDTLFSALCCEAANAGGLSRLYDYFNSGELTISDTLPYQGDEYFLTKPVLFAGDFKRRAEGAGSKPFKSLEYIPLSRFDEYLKHFSGSEIDPASFKNHFGILATHERVAIKGLAQPIPYHVTSWRFTRDSGLYLVLRFATEEARFFFEDLLTMLGYSGIGGKRSSGLGKFSIRQADLPAKLVSLLDDIDADYQMLLGTALPADEELDSALSDGWYTTIRRGGFVQSESYADRQLKKRNMYMLAPGSCLKRRFTGCIFDLGTAGTHPVWRCGKTLFAGVRL